jgi:hypothetical protein
MLIEKQCTESVLTGVYVYFLFMQDTQIEPVAAVGDKTMEPQNLTYGISYEPYGDLYLQMLRDRTT